MLQLWKTIESYLKECVPIFEFNQLKLMLKSVKLTNNLASI
jgi:hypothetical protein